ncbi:myosin light chain kinase 2, skeletal/cardiac muscle-like isoform X1 [Sinocyclocheilus rhinocerous]|uniref:myosin light chain kinase 2, skeletal/cardiac muscle-like isoform X1 n=1 Tax=Sinocyclocheilus rhinocerous TaxID=307959 RepID=UPI0007B9C3B1|nr:PREDICTED: myosin light chain kinase 2, skeletal/cardiac muscle-like isoform X1 [Sinocyclocheilus rhinocerous]
MSSNLVKSLARVYDPKPLHAQKRLNGGRATARRASLSTSNKHPSSSISDQPSSKSSSPSALVHIEGQVNDLSDKMDKLLALQEASLKRLDTIGQDQGTAAGGRSMEQMLCDVRVVIETVREKEEQQDQRLDALERLVSGIQQVVSFVAEVLKHSRLADLLKNTHSKSSSRFREKDGKEKSKVYQKGLKTQKKKKPLDASDLVQAGFEEVQKLNQQNNQLSQCTAETAVSTAAHLDLIEEEQEGEKYRERKDDKQQDAVEEEAREQEIVAELLQIKEEDKKEEDERLNQEEALWLSDESQLAALNSSGQTDESITVTPESCEENLEITFSTKRHVTDENLTDELKKSRVEEEDKELKEEEEAGLEAAEAGPERPEEGTEEERKDAEPVIDEYVIDSSPPPPAPFEHRLVTTKTHQITSYYTINKEEVLGGGRFGMVHKCVEKSSGLILAAKIIKARSQKEKEVVKCEIEVMNQLNHANLIQLYAAFESRHEIILVMEYVDGGELFDRIIDENYKLTELDTVLFIRQISEGLQYMHKMYILHLDLKPENILCVSRQTNKVKIIDFGLARRYKPREKLRVNFGTPEFLAPEVINYEFVSFPTDMWSLGVITYMLLSGLSPFLGEDDNETLNNILACQWSFEEAEFADISEEAKDFISRLLVKSKSWRMSASQSLKHPWLSDRALHYRLHHKKNKCHSSHAPPPEG